MYLLVIKHWHVKIWFELWKNVLTFGQKNGLIFGFWSTFQSSVRLQMGLGVDNTIGKTMA
jgi:hypothetical protein